MLNQPPPCMLRIGDCQIPGQGFGFALDATVLKPVAFGMRVPGDFEAGLASQLKVANLNKQPVTVTGQAMIDGVLAERTLAVVKWSVEAHVIDGEARNANDKAREAWTALCLMCDRPDTEVEE